jgi:acetylglutamate/LysW-gamma-L-alpha-aminoadipate kinase
MPRTIVVKCGGNAAVDVRLVCRDIAGLARGADRLVLVHGGSADIDRLAARMSVASRRLVAPDGVSARYTDEDMLEVVHMALAGRAKPRFVAELMRCEVPAIGLTGLDSGLLRARRKKAHRAVVDGRKVVIRDDHSGRITDVNTDLLETLLGAGQVPVISPPAMAEDGEPVNTDADRAAAAVASALGADTLVMLTGAPGVLADPADETSVQEVCAVPAEGPPPVRGGGMGLKLVASREALAGDVDRVVIADGRRADPVQAALRGDGTEVVIEDPEPAPVAADGGTPADD